MNRAPLGPQLELWEDELPDAEVATIVDQPIELRGATIVWRGEPSRPYRVGVLYLADGRTIETRARQLLDRLCTAPPDVFPLRCTIRARQSRKHPDRSYWAVELHGRDPG